MIKELESRLAKLKPGEAHVYYKGGSLAEACVSPQAKEARARRQAAQNAYDAGHVELASMRIGGTDDRGLYAYMAIGKRFRRAPDPGMTFRYAATRFDLDQSTNLR